MPPRTGHRSYTLAAVAALATAGGVLFFGMLSSGGPASPSSGVVHATEVKIAPEISGRLTRFAAMAGQSVSRGDDLAELASPELSAALVLADAQLGEARAARDRVYAGMRIEQVDTLERDIETAKADLVFAEQQYARKSALAAEGFASRQDLDQATAAIGEARAKLARAESAYQAAHLGPIREELAIADAEVEKAAAAASVIAARVAKLRIRAPSDGTVALLVAEIGEAIVPGQPVMTLEARGRNWAGFNLREDRLGELRIGSPVEVISAGGRGRITARVTEIAVRGEFATWRAARVVGDHDLNTFLVRADPVEPEAAGLEPGMTVWLDAMIVRNQQ